MSILYLHGWHSKPGGKKPTFLKSHGFELVNPHLPDEDFEESLRIAQAAYDENPIRLVIGSSRGGAVAVNIDLKETPLILIAPAWKNWGTATTVAKNVIILHSENDDVIPLSASRELLKNSQLPQTHLRVVGADHNMVDDEAYHALLSAVRESLADPQ